MQNHGLFIPFGLSGLAGDANFRLWAEINAKKLARIDAYICLCSDIAKGRKDIQSILRSIKAQESPDSWQLVLSPDVYRQTLAEMASTNYQPPSDIQSIVAHLQVLRTYYQLENEQHGINLNLELSLLNLISEAGIRIAQWYGHIAREAKRTKKAADIKKDLAAENQTLAIRAFYLLDFAEGSKLHKVAKLILSEIKQKEPTKSLNISTVKRYLQKDPKVMKHFRKEGRFIVYRK